VPDSLLTRYGSMQLLDLGPMIQQMKPLEQSIFFPSEFSKIDLRFGALLFEFAERDHDRSNGRSIAGNRIHRAIQGLDHGAIGGVKFFHKKIPWRPLTRTRPKPLIDRGKGRPAASE